jgi:hypothetical protein
MDNARIDGLEQGYPFCSNPDCLLHVLVGDPGVEGAGNWAVLPDGALTGRGIYDGVFLCDRCGHDLLAGAVRLEFEVGRHSTRGYI